MYAVSLFSGAGGMDLGVRRAGVGVVWSNDVDPVACRVYEENGLGNIACGDVRAFLPALAAYREVDLVFGGPPCQGFSVAGKMDPEDVRSALVWAFVAAVRTVRPRAFVMENVAALYHLRKWRSLRELLSRAFNALGYYVHWDVLCASHFGVPQTRARCFLVGVSSDIAEGCGGRLRAPYASSGLFWPLREEGPTVRQALAHLAPAGEGNNLRTCNAVITPARNPIIRRSPYAGMLFNGAGRPINLEGYAPTLCASLGGNKTPIIDGRRLADPDAEDWVSSYHSHLVRGGAPYAASQIPPDLRRLTVDEALALQTFPHDFAIDCGNSAAFRLIGNAVPCNLAYYVALNVLRMFLT
jgi:DNA (cytosine-5)-methyltransferase 1